MEKDKPISTPELQEKLKNPDTPDWASLTNYETFHFSADKSAIGGEEPTAPTAETLASAARQIAEKAKRPIEEGSQDSSETLEESPASRAEKEINEVLTGISYLESEISRGNRKISKTVDTENPSQVIYNINGTPFRFLQHVIDFNDGTGTQLQDKPSSQLSQKLQSDPSVWEQPRTETSRTGLSLTYKDTSNGTKRHSLENFNSTIYGFSHLQENSLVSLNHSDDWTGHDVAKNTDNSVPTPEEIKEWGAGNYPEYLSLFGSDHLNEVFVKRYDEHGEPQYPPEFIISYDGNIPAKARMHAQFFQIPIVNVSTAKKRRLFRGFR